MASAAGDSNQVAASSRARVARRSGVPLRLFAAKVLVGWLPPFVGGRLRTQVLRGLGLRVGKRSAFWHLPELIGSGALHERLTIGDDCGFNRGCVFELAAPISIGNHVAAGHDVMFLTTAPGRPDTEETAKPIVVGDGVWLGARATVMPGVTIGAGSVIAAGVTVNQDVPENTLLTGGPPISIAKWR
jgi:maltose O-acetyltransferase